MGLTGTGTTSEKEEEEEEGSTKPFDAFCLSVSSPFLLFRENPLADDIERERWLDGRYRNWERYFP